MAFVNRNSAESAKDDPPVILDDRERASGLVEELGRLLGRPPRVQRLEVGDILVRSRILIERKTAPDFEASLVDGRLFAQAGALAAQRFEPLIILEGSFRESGARLSGPALRQALLALALDWKIPVLRSASTADTALWVQELLGARRRNEPPDWRGVSPTGRRRPAAARPARPKKDRPAPDIQRRRQTQAILAAIEGVGPVRAEALARMFGSPAAVLAATHDELARTPGIGTRLAARIRLALEGREIP